MKKIGTKIISILVILFILFVMTVLGAQNAIRAYMKLTKQFSETYMKFQSDNTSIVNLLDECELYGNLMVMHTNLGNRKDIANNVADINIKVDAAEEDLITLSHTIADERLISAINDYVVEINKMQEIIDAEAEFVLEGDAVSARRVSENLYLQCSLAEEKGQEFTTLMLEIANEMKQEGEAVSQMAYKFMILFAFSFISVCVLAIFIVLKTIAGPAQKAGKSMTDIIDDIKRNEGDLTKRIEIKSNDEIGQLVKGVNSFIDNLQDIMCKIKENSEILDTHIDNINNGIIDSNTNADNVSAAMEQLSASMQEIAATVSIINDNVQSVMDATVSMRNKAENSSTMVGGIMEKASNIKCEAIASKDKASNMVGSNRQILKIAIDNSKSVDKINELTSEILSISSQTNLLALNASIEAARAGEAGKGFAVVAEEIRVLADNSRDTANKIQEISATVTKAVEELSNGADNMIQFVDTMIMDDYDKFVDVANQYHDDADNINNILKDFNNNAKELEKTMSDMTTGIEGINISINESAEGVSHAANSTTHLVDSLGMIKDEAQSNLDISNMLRSEVARFKTIQKQ